MPAKKAFGTLLKTDHVTPGTFVTIANVTGLKPWSQKVDIIDATSHDSPNEYREKLASLKDSGECQFDLNFSDENAGHKWLSAQLGAVKPFKIVFPAGSGSQTVSFDAVIKSFEPGAPYDGKLTASCVLDITGVLTWAASV